MVCVGSENKGLALEFEKLLGILGLPHHPWTWPINTSHVLQSHDFVYVAFIDLLCDFVYG
jgi:hypothetical protein